MSADVGQLFELTAAGETPEKPDESSCGFVKAAEAFDCHYGLLFDSSLSVGRLNFDYVRFCLSRLVSFQGNVWFEKDSAFLIDLMFNNRLEVIRIVGLSSLFFDRLLLLILWLFHAFWQRKNQ